MHDATEAAGHGASHPAGYPDAEPLAPAVLGASPEATLARRLLADAYAVDVVDARATHGPWLLVGADGTVFDGRTGRVRSSPGDTDEQRVLAERNRREQLLVQAEAAVQAEHAAKGALGDLEVRVAETSRARDDAADITREHDRARITAEEAVRRAAWAIDERRRMPESGEAAVLRAQLTGELDAERRGLERAERERERRAERIALLEGKIAAESAGWRSPQRPNLTRIAKRVRVSHSSCVTAPNKKPRCRASCDAKATNSLAWKCAASARRISVRKLPRTSRSSQSTLDCPPRLAEYHWRTTSGRS
jgi:hypothetical protein